MSILHMRHRLVSALILCQLLACGASPGSHTVAMPGDDEDTGSITLIFSNKASDVVVAISGTLVVDGVNAKRLQIHQVPSGYADLAIAADGVERQLRVWVDSDRDTAVPVGNPPKPPSQNPLLTMGLSIFALLVSRAATDYLF